MTEPLIMQPPHSAEAEQSLIGAVLIANAAFDGVSWLPADAFYLDRHVRLWKCIGRMIEAGKPADVVTVCTELGADLEKAGGPGYIAGLAQNTPSAMNARRYAEMVNEKHMRRRLAQATTEIGERAMSNAPEDIGRLLDDAESRIFQLSESRGRRANGPVPISPVLARVFERIDELHAKADRSPVTGVPTGYVDLDHKTAGMQPGDLIVLAGRPSMGKTALALNIAEHVALSAALPVLVFSMEMSAEQLGQRLLSSVAKVDHHHLRTGDLSDVEWPALTDGIEKLNDAQIHIDDTGALTALEVRARARRMRREHGKLGLVVVDYLQLMSASGHGENRATEISEISRSLKALAKELDCPVLALSQLSRAVEQRSTRVPMMSDLRESGAIEQDADVILFIYRDEVYNPDDPELKGRAELIIGKQRNGPIGKVQLTFIGRLARFENCAEPWDATPRVPKSKAKVRNFDDFKSKAAGE